MVSPLECIYSVACSLCDGPDHRGTPIGTRRINSVVAQERDGFNPRFHYMDSPMGGYGLYYATVMQSIGLVALADRRLGLTVDAVTPAGQRVADAFRSVVADTEYYRHWIDRHDEPVPHAAAAEYGRRACYCRLREPGASALNALASGQGRTDLLKRAGDFDLGDAELEELLAQLEAALVVDRGSIWRMLKRKVPESSYDDASTSIAYDELDWDAIQSHPKLAQYRNWDQRSSADPTDLGILLTSIAERFEADVRRGRTGDPGTDGGDSSSDGLDDLAKAIEAEDEEAAEENEAVQQKRRLTLRARAKRQFHSFVKRFVNGLTDGEFVRHVGPSVIVPSYVVFNHLCWKLIQIDLADPVRIIGVQTTLWRFFWGDKDEPGHLAALSIGEQEAVLEILDRHHSEAVLLCSLFQAHAYARHQEEDTDLVEVRDAWPVVLLHPRWRPTRPALGDSATLLRHWCRTAHDLIERLDSLASYVSVGEPLAIIGQALACRPEQVAITSGGVNRGSLGTQHVPIYTVEDPDASLTPDSASRAFASLAALHPEVEYIRLEDRSHDIIAFADYRHDSYVHANRITGDDQVLDPPAIETPPWRAALQTLYEMVGDEVAAA